MNTLGTKMPPLAFAGLKMPGRIPRWAQEFDATRATIADLCRAARLPEISVLQSTGPRQLVGAGPLLQPLFHILLEQSNRSARVVFGFQRSDPKELFRLVSILGEFPGLECRVEFASGKDELKSATFEAMTKVLASRHKTDPLAQVRSVIESSQILRASNGRLDAKKIAKVFGMSLSELAGQINVSKQSMSKTPDSLALQPKLREYERIARLRTELSDVEFKIWLNTPNDNLEDGDAPIGYLKEGASASLAAFAENMMTGAPT